MGFLATERFEKRRASQLTTMSSVMTSLCRCRRVTLVSLDRGQDVKLDDVVTHAKHFSFNFSSGFSICSIQQIHLQFFTMSALCMLINRGYISLSHIFRTYI